MSAPIEERERLAEEVAASAHRLLDEFPGLRSLTVHVKQGTPGGMEGCYRLTAPNEPPLTGAEARMLAAELRKVLRAAAREGTATGKIILQVAEGAIDAALSTRECDGWAIPDLGGARS